MMIKRRMSSLMYAYSSDLVRTRARTTGRLRVRAAAPPDATTAVSGSTLDALASGTVTTARASIARSCARFARAGVRSVRRAPARLFGLDDVVDLTSVTPCTLHQPRIGDGNQPR